MAGPPLETDSARRPALVYDIIPRRVIVIARVRPRPGRSEDFVALLKEVQEASRADDGCLHDGYFSEVADATSFIAVEEWRDMPALDAHLRQPHVARLVDALPALADGRPEIRVHEVASSGKLPA